MNNKLLPQKLKELRKINNYTQDYVAEVLGVVRQTYMNSPETKISPSIATIFNGYIPLLRLVINITISYCYGLSHFM